MFLLTGLIFWVMRMAVHDLVVYLHHRCRFLTTGREKFVTDYSGTRLNKRECLVLSTTDASGITAYSSVPSGSKKNYSHRRTGLMIAWISLSCIHIGGISVDVGSGTILKRVPSPGRSSQPVTVCSKIDAHPGRPGASHHLYLRRFFSFSSNGTMK